MTGAEGQRRRRFCNGETDVTHSSWCWVVDQGPRVPLADAWLASQQGKVQVERHFQMLHVPIV